MSVIKLGYAPTRRFVFSREDALKYKDIIKQKIESFGMEIDIVDLSSINDEGLLHKANEEDAIIQLFKNAEVDALFFPHCNFGTEDAVARVAKAVGKPVLLW